MYAGVEGGGTTWRVALAEGHPTNITESKSFKTVDNAQEQLKEIKDWLSTRKYDCLGIGTFGPVDPRQVSLVHLYAGTCKQNASPSVVAPPPPPPLSFSRNQ